ncbi:MAG: T9SS type A sorting domain-containing protein [Chitinophagales bacterium]|nr:T9SS type A sorting domain-containing protein [Chitinophagales bacterium]
MKRLYYSFLAYLFFFSGISIYAQSTTPLIKWQECIGGSLNDEARNMKCTPDGGFIVTGYTESDDGDVTSNFGKADYWVVKCDNKAKLQWQQNYGGSLKDWARYIDFTVDNGFAVIGNSESKDIEVTNNHGADDFWMMKLDSNGNLQFEKSLGGSGQDFGYSIHQTQDSGSIIFGGTESTNGQVTENYGDVDYWAVKLNVSGDLIWEKAYGGSMHEEGSSLSITSNGGYIISGYSNSTDGDVSGNHGSYDVWIVKTDAAGKIDWSKCYGGSLDDGARDIEPTPDGGYVIAGYASSSDGDVTKNQGGKDLWIIKIDARGEIIWQKTYGGSASDYAYSVKLDADEDFLIAGYTFSSDGDISVNYGGADVWVLKIDKENGNIIWQKTMGGSGDDTGRSLSQNTSGDYILAGITGSNNHDVLGLHGKNDAWVVNLCIPNTFYLDADGDGYGTPSDTQMVCTNDLPAGYVANHTDCNDKKAGIHPGAEETCNSVDDDCNGKVDDGVIDAVVTAEGPTRFCRPDSVKLVASLDKQKYSYQWLKDGSILQGATTTVYFADKSGSYAISISENGCSATSNTVEVTANSIPVATLSPSEKIKVCPGIKVTFTATEDPGYLYQWYKNDKAISGATRSMYTTNKEEEGSYSVIVTNKNLCSAESPATVLNRYADPDAIISPQGDLDICITGNVLLKANAGSGFRYQWIKNGDDIAGATKKSYTAKKTGIYEVSVTNSNDCTNTSSPVTVYSSCKIEQQENLIPQISIFPNPNNGSFIVAAKQIASPYSDIKIINVLGKAIFNEHVVIINNEINKAINLPPVASGFYLIELNTGNQVITQIFLVKR